MIFEHGPTLFTERKRLPEASHLRSLLIKLASAHVIRLEIHSET